MPLLVGQQAPDFVVNDLYGNRIALEDYRGVCVLLSFYRFAVCPVCNIRMWRLAQMVSSYQKRGLYFVACIESSPENAHYYLDRLDYPFPMIPELGGTLYDTYGVRQSVMRVFYGMAIHPNIYLEAQMRNLGGWNIRRFDGKFSRMPADFLIGPTGRIMLAHYGQEHGDFLPLEQLDQLLQSVPPVKPLPDPLYNGQPLPPYASSPTPARLGGSGWSQPSRPSQPSQPFGPQYQPYPPQYQQQYQQYPPQYQQQPSQPSYQPLIPPQPPRRKQTVPGGAMQPAPMRPPMPQAQPMQQMQQTPQMQQMPPMPPMTPTPSSWPDAGFSTDFEAQPTMTLQPQKQQGQQMPQLQRTTKLTRPQPQQTPQPQSQQQPLSQYPPAPMRPPVLQPVPPASDYSQPSQPSQPQPGSNPLWPPLPEHPEQ